MCEDPIYIPVTTRKTFANCFLGPGLISVSPCLSNNIKTKNKQKKKRIILEFYPMNTDLHLFMEIEDR